MASDHGTAASSLVEGWAASVATISLGVVGVGSLLVMPVLVGVLEHAHGSSDGIVPRFTAVQSWSISAGCILSLVIADRFALRTISLVAIACLVLADAATPAISSAGGLLICRAVAGLAGGLAVALATGVLARMRGTERQFGLLVLAQLIFAMIGPLLIPAASAISGLSGIQAAFGYLACCDLVAGLLVLSLMPSMELARKRQPAGANTSRGWIRVTLILLGILGLYCGIGAYWPYVEGLGEASGLTSQQIGHFLGLGAVGGILGSFAPAFLGARLTRAASILISVTSLVAAMIVTEHFASSTMFFIGTLLYYFGWYASVPCFLALLAAADRDGRPTLLSMSLVGIGFGMGSALAGMRSGAPQRVEIALIASAAAILLALGAIAMETNRHGDEE